MARQRVRTTRARAAVVPGAGPRAKVARSKRRRTWAIRPATRPHSTPKGKKGYDRRRDRQVELD
jgi:hypothetical protein